MKSAANLQRPVSAWMSFIGKMRARLSELPHCMLATSTHDTKRSEDVRARLAALSELAEEWSRAVRRWQTMNLKHRREIDGETAPDANEEYLLYQTLLGAWPLEGLHDGNRAEFTQRIKAYMEKAVREAKVNSSWLEPNAAWDEAVREFVGALLTSNERNRFPRTHRAAGSTHRPTRGGEFADADRAKADLSWRA